MADCKVGDREVQLRDRLEEEEDSKPMAPEDADSSDTAEDDEEVDPRIEENLEILNQSCTEINRLENEVDEARKKYRSTFQTASQRLEELGGKMPKTIQRARQYFELVQKGKEAHSEALRAARLYQSAQTTYRAAKEMLTLAEKGLEDSCSNSRSLSSAWQETLSHAVEKVMEAEKEKRRKEEEHNKRAAICAEIESQVHFLEKKFKRSISKARPYFETRAELELKLSQLKQNVSDLQQTIAIRKVSYTSALRNLEMVSTEIHESRRSREKLLLQFPREPGVGAETDSLGSSISDPHLDRGVFSSTAFFDDEDIDESDEEGEVFSADSGTSSLPQSPLAACPGKQPNGEGEDSGNGNSDACECVSVFSRSVSGTSAFSSESQSDSAPQSPCATVVPATPAVACAAPSKGGSGVITSATHCPQRLVDLAQGDVGCRSVAGDGSSPGTGPCDRCGSAGADSADTRNAPGTESEVGESAKDSQKDSQLQATTLSTPECQREDGDGSAQDEECLREVDSASATVSQIPATQNGAAGHVQSPDVQGKVAAPPQLNGADVTVESVSGVSYPASSPKPATEEVKTRPLHRTDAIKRRSLQGLMLNPSDLFRFGSKH